MIDTDTEPTKSIATLLNTGAAASFTIGLIGPSAAALHGAPPRVPPLLFCLVASGWLLVAASLHSRPRFISGRLR